MIQGRREITPTLLFARQETAIGLDLTDGSMVGGTVTLDFDGHASMTLAQVSWAPYRYNPELGPDRQPIGWERYPTRLYWDKLEAQFTAAFRNLPEEVNEFRDDEYAVIGQMLAARSLYFTIEAGVTSLVQMGSENEGPQPDVVLPYTNEGNLDSDAGIATGAAGAVQCVLRHHHELRGGHDRGGGRERGQEHGAEAGSRPASREAGPRRHWSRLRARRALPGGSRVAAAKKWFFQTEGKGFRGIGSSGKDSCINLVNLHVRHGAARGAGDLGGDRVGCAGGAGGDDRVRWRRWPRRRTRWRRPRGRWRRSAW